MKIERLRGVNLGGWFSQVNCIEEKDSANFPGLIQHIQTFLSSADFERIHDAGFNHVRLPIDYFNLFSEKELQPKEEIFALLDKEIKDILATGLHVILDLHKCPGHDFFLGCTEDQPLFSDPQALERTCGIWAYMAERYESDPRIMMELLNEPVSLTSEGWNKTKEVLFKTIRKHALHTTIVVGSNKWNSAKEFESLTPIDDDNLIYSFHSYTPVCFTHQNASWIDDSFYHQERSWPGDYLPPSNYSEFRLDYEYGHWDKNRLQESVQNALDFREKYKVPVACNEFGVYVQTPRKFQLAWVKDFLDILKSADVGFSYWNYKNLDFGIVSIGEDLHKNLQQYRGPDHLDSELMDLLSKG